MAQRKHAVFRIFRIFGWVILSLLGFILLITLAFYLTRGWIMQKAVEYVNEQQSGEIQMGQMNLIPFMYFPDVSLQLRNLGYYEQKVYPDSLHQEPILSLNEVYVSLDVVELLKGNIQVSRADLMDGFVRYLIYEDSVSNMERALGSLLGNDGLQESTNENPEIRIDLEGMELSNVTAIYEDRTNGDRARATIHQVASTFQYMAEKLWTDLQLLIEVSEFKYQKYRIEEPKIVSLNSRLEIDLEQQLVELKPSSVSVSGLDLEAWGSLILGQNASVDMAFRAKNEGLELLNYLFRGILDLDEIEQIGAGNMYLSGNINGKLGDRLPVVRINGMADGIGFRINAIQRDVTDISFKLYATNGTNPDMSDGKFVLEGFTAIFPEGYLNANIIAQNALVPEVKIEVVGEVDLIGLDRMLTMDAVKGLKGEVTINGDMEGRYDLEAGTLMSENGNLITQLEKVGFMIQTDSLTWTQLKEINGKIYYYDNELGTEDFSFEMNGNRMEASVKTKNLVQYFLGLERDVSANLAFRSDTIFPESLTGDTAISSLLGERLTDVRFQVKGSMEKRELDLFLRSDSLPKMKLEVDSLNMGVPYFADPDNMRISLSIGPDTLVLHELSGRIGESGFHSSGALRNLSAWIDQKGQEQLDIDFNIASERLRAEDLLVHKNVAMLPSAYATEYMENLNCRGSVRVPVSGLLNDTIPLDLNLDIAHLGWNFRYYPLAFENFRMKVRKEGDGLFIDDFQGRLGESNLKMNAHIGNTSDTVIENLYGEMTLESDLLDFNQLMSYQLPEELQVNEETDSSDIKEVPRLDEISYPRFAFNLDIGEIRYGAYKLFGLNGNLRSTPEKILYLDQLEISGESGGEIIFNGQFNVSNPRLYNFSTFLDLSKVNINDLDFEMEAGEETYTLKENFQGLVSAEGIAEIFITPDLKFDVSTTTAAFNVMVEDGALINFTPLQAAAKYFDNADLNDVRYVTSQSSFTLADSKINVSAMNVESTAGQFIIQGEQGLDNSYLYLLHLPTWLVRGAARSVVSESGKDQTGDQIHKMELGKYLMVTVWGKGEESEVKLGDRRDRYQ